MQRELSNYMEVIPYNEDVILFNKLNGNIVLLEKEHVTYVEGKNIIECNDEDAKILDNGGFLIDDVAVRKYIRKECVHQCILKKTSVILSVTEKCNLSCKYCYQSAWKKSNALSDSDYVSMVLRYFKEIIPKIDDIGGVLNIYFMGGEPLLKSELIIQIAQEILLFVENKHYIHLEVKFNIDTNGLFLTRDFIEKFPNLSVSTTLSLADDHNNLRSKSFEQLYGILSTLTEVFDGTVYRLTIRYNIHHGNFNELDRFITMLDSIGIRYSLDVQNIMNTSTADFFNNLNDADFEKIYLSKIVPCLLKHDILPDILPDVGLSRHCSCFNELSRKYYSNGQIVLCDAIPRSDSKLPLGEMPLLPEICINCYDFPYCGGPKPCDTSKCTGIYEKKAVVRNRIVTYMKYRNILSIKEKGEDL